MADINWGLIAVAELVAVGGLFFLILQSLRGIKKSKN